MNEVVVNFSALGGRRPVPFNALSLDQQIATVQGMRPELRQMIFDNLLRNGSPKAIRLLTLIRGDHDYQ